MTPTQVVIAGAGLAGVRTAERLRARGFAGRLVILGAEGEHPYDRPPLSKQVLRGEPGPPMLLSDAAYRELDVRLELGSAVGDLDVVARTVRAGAQSIAYDALVIATGARPRRVPGVHGRVLRTYADAIALRAELVPGAQLVVVGAGLIGLEVAASARALGVGVTVLDALPGPMTRVVGPSLGRVISHLHTSHGVALHHGVTAVRAGARTVALSDRTTLPADVVLEAVGVEPDVAWLAGSGVAIDDGVRCDSAGRASADGIYAVGDVACWAGARAEHWSNAVAQADHVAAAILGQPAPEPALPYWWSDQYDVKIQGLGRPRPDDDVELAHWGPQRRTVAVYSRDNRLTGVVGLSAPRAIALLRPHVAAGTAVGEALATLATSGVSRPPIEEFA